MHPDELVGNWSCSENGCQLRINPDGEFCFLDSQENEENTGSWFVIDDELHFRDDTSLSGKYHFSIENIIMELEAIDESNSFREEALSCPLIRED